MKIELNLQKENEEKDQVNKDGVILDEKLSCIQGKTTILSDFDICWTNMDYIIHEQFIKGFLYLRFSSCFKFFYLGDDQSIKILYHQIIELPDKNAVGLFHHRQQGIQRFQHQNGNQLSKSAIFKIKETKYQIEYLKNLEKKHYYTIQCSDNNQEYESFYFIVKIKVPKIVQNQSEITEKYIKIRYLAQLSQNLRFDRHVILNQCGSQYLNFHLREFRVFKMKKISYKAIRQKILENDYVEIMSQSKNISQMKELPFVICKSTRDKKRFTLNVMNHSITNFDQCLGEVNLIKLKNEVNSLHYGYYFLEIKKGDMISVKKLL
ncbi:UNKNOWN [Stylonychia lemnae]|uniref:Uncharacterized protein n=1 Tax=Stylonychia lemnae TaxID=5949 RepID=A0A077ZUY7_STYLE|nr:UNKNOWN [Stylonychia lemnae]|eukprot:CDW73710.1 UNKNOWN [Stylonychia lemnae]